FDFRQHQRHHLVEKARVPPEDMERLIEYLVLLVALHEGCAERPVEILARTDARRLDGFYRVKYLTGADAETGATQYACEMQDVFGKTAMIFRRTGWHPTPPPSRPPGFPPGC